MVVTTDSREFWNVFEEMLDNDKDNIHAEFMHIRNHQKMCNITNMNIILIVSDVIYLRYYSEISGFFFILVTQN